jgi:DNA-binding PadR family transcriptional regulator
MPMTGYALRQAIRDVLGHFWSESFGQIYPTLASLQRRGLVARVRAGRSTQYTITDAGLAQLAQLLRAPVQHAPPRNGLLLRLFFGRQLGPLECQRLVLDARREAEQLLVRYEGIRAEIGNDTETEADHGYWLLTVAAGEHAARATIAWADESLGVLVGGGLT